MKWQRHCVDASARARKRWKGPFARSGPIPTFLAILLKTRICFLAVALSSPWPGKNLLGPPEVCLWFFSGTAVVVRPRSYINSKTENWAVILSAFLWIFRDLQP